MPRKKASKKREMFIPGSPKSIVKRPKPLPLSRKEKKEEKMIRIKKTMPVSTFRAILASENAILMGNQALHKNKSSVESTGIPPLSKTEKSKYAKYYPRRDVIEFLDREEGDRNYIIEVNGKEVPIPYAKYILLLFLAIKLKRDIGNGWTTVKELYDEKIVKDYDGAHVQHLVSDLKKAFKSAIEPNAKAELIQNKRKGKYRFSTMPSRIKTPYPKWLKQTLISVKNSVLAEREVRKKQAERLKKDEM